MSKGTAVIAVLSLPASAYVAAEWEHHWMIGGWAGVGWFASIVGCAALLGAAIGLIERRLSRGQ